MGIYHGMSESTNKIKKILNAQLPAYKRVYYKTGQ